MGRIFMLCVEFVLRLNLHFLSAAAPKERIQRTTVERDTVNSVDRLNSVLMQ